MRLAITIALLGFLSTYLVSAAHTVQFVNHCSHDLYFWTVGHWTEGEANDRYIAVSGNGSSVVHDMVRTSIGGVSLKIRDRPHYVPAPKGILQAEYRWEPENNMMWYDFSAIDCGRYLEHDDPYWCPFLPGGVRMYIPGADPEVCQTAECMPGTTCESTYTRPGSYPGEPSYVCADSYDVIFETCAANDAPQTLPSAEDEYEPISDDSHQLPPDDGYYQPLPQPSSLPSPRPRPHIVWWPTISHPPDNHSSGDDSTNTPVSCGQEAPEHPDVTSCWDDRCACSTGSSPHVSDYTGDSRDCSQVLYSSECRRVARGQLGQRQDVAIAVE